MWPVYPRRLENKCDNIFTYIPVATVDQWNRKEQEKHTEKLLSFHNAEGERITIMPNACAGWKFVLKMSHYWKTAGIWFKSEHMVNIAERKVIKKDPKMNIKTAQWVRQGFVNVNILLFHTKKAKYTYYSSAGLTAQTPLLVWTMQAYHVVEVD